MKPVKTDNFKIKTQIGTLEGMINMPDSIFNLSYNHNLYDTLIINDSLEINFNGNADYYVLKFWISYLIPPDTLTFHTYSAEIISKTNKFTISSSQLNKNGMLGISSIESFNGPFLETGSPANMSGDGKGFLYSKVHQYILDYFYIKK